MPASPPSRPSSHPALLIALGFGAGVLSMWLWQGKRAQPSSAGIPTTLPARSDPRRESFNPTALLDRSTPAGDALNQLGAAIALTDQDDRAEALRRLAGQLADTDLTAALALGTRIPDANDKLAYLRALFAAWAGRDPRAALDYLKANFPPGQLQSEALNAGLGRWAGTKPQAAWEWLQANLSGPLKEQGMASLVQGWTRHDPESAGAWFVSTGSTAQGILDALVTTWADLNPRSAAAWVESLAHEGNKLTGRVCLASEWVQQDAAAAAEYFTPMLTAGRQGLDLAAALTNAWGAADPAAAAEWIDRLPAGPARQEAAGVLATVWAASDIQAAIAWTQKLDVPEMKAAAIDHLGTTWGAIDPQKALAWLDTLPADETRTDATRGALDSWAGTDPEAMKTWIAGQPAGATADLARISLGEVYAENAPADALQLALGIENATRRGDALARFFRIWRRADDSAAQQWLQGHWGKLAPELQQRIAAEQRKPMP